MTTAGDVLRLLAALGEAGIECWVDGGWGVDALLGEQTRPHDDVDLVIPADRTDAALAVLALDGFVVIRDLLPTAIALRDPSGREVDLHPVTLLADGTATQELSGDPALAPTPFSYGTAGAGTIGGVAVRCVDARTQLLAHEGYPPRDRDRADVLRLAAAFGLPMPAAYLAEA